MKAASIHIVSDNPLAKKSFFDKLGEKDIEAYMHSDVCPWCRTTLPKTEKEYRKLEKLMGTDFYEEYRKKEVESRRGTRNRVNPDT